MGPNGHPSTTGMPTKVVDVQEAQNAASRDRKMARLVHQPSVINMMGNAPSTAEVGNNSIVVGFLTIVSIVLIVVTMPLSLFLTIRMVQVMVWIFNDMIGPIVIIIIEVLFQFYLVSTADVPVEYPKIGFLHWIFNFISRYTNFKM